MECAWSSHQSHPPNCIQQVVKILSSMKPVPVIKKIRDGCPRKFHSLPGLEDLNKKQNNANFPSPKKLL